MASHFSVDSILRSTRGVRVYLLQDLYSPYIRRESSKFPAPQMLQKLSLQKYRVSSTQSQGILKRQPQLLMKVFSTGSCRGPERNNGGLQTMNIPKKTLIDGPNIVSGSLNKNTMAVTIIFYYKIPNGNCSLTFFFFFFLPRCAACGILLPQPGTEPRPQQ